MTYGSEIDWWIDWCFTARQHKIGQFDPKASVPHARGSGAPSLPLTLGFSELSTIVYNSLLLSPADEF